MSALTAPTPWDDPPSAVPEGPASAPVDDFRDAMARLAGGVGVLTTRDLVGRDCGITVTAVSSVSLDPPLVLTCVRRGGFVHDALLVADGWALTMLDDSQLALAHYAARHRHPGGRDDFSPWPTRRGSASGALVFTAGVSAIECVPDDLVDAGDHTIAIGRVVAVASDATGERPLVYVDRAYRAAGGPLA
ncbi:MAG: flavin reductase family protein [Jiangellaceae bacterium]